MYTIEGNGLTRDYFVYVSGEAVRLAKAETEALLAIGAEEIVVEWTGRLGRFSSKSDVTSFLLERAAFIKSSGRVLAEFREIEDIPRSNLMGAIDESETFAVRVLRLGECDGEGVGDDLPAHIGSLLLKYNKAEVSLDNPDNLFLVICSTDGLLLTISEESRTRKLLGLREPGRKRFFHPSMMNAKLARAMCNLARIMPGDLVLDPFCGGGGILCEVTLIGATAIGVDLDWSLLMGARINLGNPGELRSCLVQADAKYCPVHSCDCIVTDPPYGRSSSTRGRRAKRLVSGFLENVDGILEKGGRLCFCASTDMNLLDVVTDLGIEIETVINLRVHSGLVRQVFSLVI